MRRDVEGPEPEIAAEDCEKLVGAIKLLHDRVSKLETRELGGAMGKIQKTQDMIRAVADGRTDHTSSAQVVGTNREEARAAEQIIMFRVERANAEIVGLHKHIH